MPSASNVCNKEPRKCLQHNWVSWKCFQYNRAQKIFFAQLRALKMFVASSRAQKMFAAQLKALEMFVAQQIAQKMCAAQLRSLNMFAVQLRSLKMFAVQLRAWIATFRARSASSVVGCRISRGHLPTSSSLWGKIALKNRTQPLARGKKAQVLALSEHQCQLSKKWTSISSTKIGFKLTFYLTFGFPWQW